MALALSYRCGACRTTIAIGDRHLVDFSKDSPHGFVRVLAVSFSRIAARTSSSHSIMALLRTDARDMRTKAPPMQGPKEH